MSIKKSYIGKVEINITEDSKKYSDGHYEDLLEKFFKSGTNPPNETQIADFLQKNSDWPMIYHLSPLRKTLLNWYNFKPKSSLLEIGAGCGAVTDVFLDNCSEVTSLELTQKRASILANRYRDRDNLSVHVGNIQNYKPNNKYDYVTCIGVLEYSGSFIKSVNPYEDFIKLCRSNLKSGGTFILAIENKLGLKYWSGAREDHTWRFFDSIEGYPVNKEKVTFSKSELKRMLNNCGFKDVEFYYPVPDMKLPTEIYSEEFEPNKTTMISPLVIPAPALDAPREEVFNEWLALNNLVDSEDFGTFSNSFLVMAK